MILHNLKSEVIISKKNKSKIKNTAMKKLEAQKKIKIVTAIQYELVNLIALEKAIKKQKEKGIDPPEHYLENVQKRICKLENEFDTYLK